MLKLEEMTPEQKLGRVLCARRFGNPEDVEFTIEMIKNSAVGALQIPCRDKEKSRELIDKFRAAADYPLIIVNDMESKFPLSDLPAVQLMSLAACNNPEYTRAFAASIAKEARDFGYSGNWGPCVDIQHSDAPCSVGRNMSDTPEETFEMTKEIFKVYDSYRFHATAKHYPGGNGLPVDSHMVEGHCFDSEEELVNGDLIPYIKLYNEGLLPAIMSQHAVFPKIDSLPASLSKKVIDIIRNQGFDGVVYTDSLAMMGILQKYGERRAMAMALMAGNDIILPNYRTPTMEVYNMMLESYRDGEITDERLDEAVRRVMALEQYCAAQPENPYPVPENIEKILNCISRDCITADCEKGYSPAINTDKKRLFIVNTTLDYDDSLDKEISFGTWYSPKLVCQSIKERFPDSEIQLLSEFPKALDNERVLNAATKYDEVVFVSYCNSSAYIGTDSMTRRVEAVINALALSNKICALVHFGNPMAVNRVEHVNMIPRIIFGYKSMPSQIYAFDVLAGKIPARGKMPFPTLYKCRS